jgi:hypothetical protein
MPWTAVVAPYFLTTDTISISAALLMRRPFACRMRNAFRVPDS